MLGSGPALLALTEYEATIAVTAKIDYTAAVSVYNTYEGKYDKEEGNSGASWPMKVPSAGAKNST